MIKPWTVLSTRYEVDNRWLKLRADVCETPAGHVLDPFYVLERANWVAVIALTEAREVVLTREYRHGAGVVGLGLPGGVVDKADADAIAAGARELKEETGYACAEWRLLGSAWANWRNQSNRLSILLGLNAHRVSGQALDAAEDIEVVLQPWQGWLDGLLTEPTQAYYWAAAFLAERALATANP